MRTLVASLLVLSAMGCSGHKEARVKARQQAGRPDGAECRRLEAERKAVDARIADEGAAYRAATTDGERQARDRELQTLLHERQVLTEARHVASGDQPTPQTGYLDTAPPDDPLCLGCAREAPCPP